MNLFSTPSHFSILCVLLVGSWGWLPVEAALVWEQKEIMHEVQPQDSSAVGVFKFKNEGPDPVTIQANHSSCGCTVAQMEKKTFAPGDSGEVKVTFQFGSRTGQQQQSVQVRTSDSASDATLKLSVTIPKLYTLTPTLVFWRTGEGLKSKEAVLKIEDDQGAKLLSVISSDPRILVKSETVRDGKEYKITVTPSDKISSEMVKSIITLQTDLPAGPKASTHIYAFIKR